MPVGFVYICFLCPPGCRNAYYIYNIGVGFLRCLSSGTVPTLEPNIVAQFIDYQILMSGII